VRGCDGPESSVGEAVTTWSEGDDEPGAKASTSAEAGEDGASDRGDASSNRGTGVGASDAEGNPCGGNRLKCRMTGTETAIPILRLLRRITGTPHRAS
jgi:hypothetical protein